MHDPNIEYSHDRILFTPGPLTTSRTVKYAGLKDLGSRDTEFMHLTQSIRKKLLKAANLNEQHFTSVLMQGCGTFSVESVITSTTPPAGKLLVISNGVYGDRMHKIAATAKIDAVYLKFPENKKPDLNEIASALKSDPKITNIAMVHCETTSGIFNQIEEVGKLARKFNKTYFVDAMSSFGAAAIDFEAAHIDFLATSSSKCLEGTPIIGIVFARKAALDKTEGYARSLSLDLYSQWKDLETKSEFRFTPPIPAILSLNQALDELEREGGASARARRYQNNHRILIEGMLKMGFRTFLDEKDLGYIINSFHYLEHKNFDYKTFYEKIRDLGYVIYSGKITNTPCFRIGNIGRIFESDIKNLLSAINGTLSVMDIKEVETLCLK